MATDTYGAPAGARTPDVPIKSRVLYQLSYGRILVGRAGFEPANLGRSGFTDRLLYPLAYRPMWQRQRESNPHIPGQSREPCRWAIPLNLSRCVASRPHRSIRQDTKTIVMRDYGRGEANRTPNLRFWRPLLYQLSYTRLTAGSSTAELKSQVRDRPGTAILFTVLHLLRTSQLHRRDWCSKVGLNHRPHDYQSYALPTELLEHMALSAGFEPATLRLTAGCSTN